jgi:hypothetical protein
VETGPDLEAPGIAPVAKNYNSGSRPKLGAEHTSDRSNCDSNVARRIVRIVVDADVAIPEVNRARVDRRAQVTPVSTDRIKVRTYQRS